MKVFCCSMYQECDLFTKGGVYALKRSFDLAVKEIQHQINVDFEAGSITSKPELDVLYKSHDVGSEATWIAVAFSKPDDGGHRWRYRYQIDELSLDLRER